MFPSESYAGRRIRGAVDKALLSGLNTTFAATHARLHTLHACTPAHRPAPPSRWYQDPGLASMPPLSLLSSDNIGPSNFGECTTMTELDILICARMAD